MISQQSMKRIGYTALAIFLTVFLWEHVGRINNVDIRPSVALNWLSEKSEDFFRFLGFLWAKLSSFLSWLDFEEMFRTLQDLIKPLISIYTSPLMMIKGYTTTLREYDNWYMLIIGSLMIIAISAYIAYTYVPKSFHTTCITFCKYVGVYLISALLLSLFSGQYHRIIIKFNN